jgi:catechol 2,3-dioxygenase-like lactoylglutathione lyase family enzyme
MLTDNDPISFIATRDPVASRAFYEGKLGLRLVSDEHFALVFELNGHMLRLAKVTELTPAKHTVLGWHVSNISESVRALGARGVLFERFEGMNQDELGIWASPSGAKVAWFKDPDGNSLSLTQFPKSDAA